MGWFWIWGGECFGYRDGTALFTYFGKEVGRFAGGEINESNGRYRGEVMSDNRLITSRSKKSWVKGSFGSRRSGSYARYANYAGFAMYAGYEDFPTPDTFRARLIMDAFEQLVSEILWMSGFWVRTSVKVELRTSFLARCTQAL